MREKIPTTAVVFNNRQWGAEKKNQVKIKELETTRKAHLSIFHSLIFGITKLDSRREK